MSRKTRKPRRVVVLPVCISRDWDSPRVCLCGKPEPKVEGTSSGPILHIKLAPDGEVPSPLTLRKTGAPAVCPECVVAHLLDGLTHAETRAGTFGAVMRWLRDEASGKPQYSATIERYTQAFVAAVASAASPSAAGSALVH